MKRKFYKSGLRFECTGCGNCCSDPHGYVQTTIEEAQKIAAYLSLSETEFLKTYTNFSGEENPIFLNSFEKDSPEILSQSSEPDDLRNNSEQLKVGDCIFLKDNQCSIYPVRPLQCRTFPFWPENLKSPYRWKITAKSCPGIDEGRVYVSEEIEALLALMKQKG